MRHGCYAIPISRTFLTAPRGAQERAPSAVEDVFGICGRKEIVRLAAVRDASTKGKTNGGLVAPPHGRYSLGMTVTIPDEAIAGLGLTAEEARVDLAAGLFADGRVTVARGARVAGLFHLQFQRELGRRQIPVHYDVGEFERDLLTLRETDQE